MDGQPDREGVLVQLRRERGLSQGGDYRLPLYALNRLILQSGWASGLPKLAIYIVVGALFAFAGMLFLRDSVIEALIAAVVCTTLIAAPVSIPAGGKKASARSSRRARHHRAQPRAGHRGDRHGMVAASAIDRSESARRR